MNSEPVDRGMRGRLIASMAGTLLFVYVASPGPVVAYWTRHHGLNEQQELDALVRIYYPLEKLCDVCPPLGKAYQWYFEWCSDHLGAGR